ncbi:hypothetical protein IC757_15935 [Wenzhouxiangella sp. AB-CW3]|uniref:hypothetical protein n=1 Tax=Wenzhouxiangella sp. AB-CW3 TaxID=2771012 RepID=UPI00168AF068|nr:hypothetical protein [Wenzhouxiangella sp. AB-CW3]QOC22473.1 hypothetical protein IC757_15935 [Wenzhouxiangella sp. AB-CW3]
MRYKTVKDVLDWTAELHKQLGDLARKVADNPERARLKLVVDYLADHEARLKDAIVKFEEASPDGVLATWFDRAPEIELPDLEQEAVALAHADNIEQAVSRVVEFHEHIVGIYTQLAEQTNNEKIRELFENLAALENHDKLHLVRNAHHLRDM